MANLLASDITAGSAKAVHAGVTTRISTYTLNQTASASTTIQVCALPAGAEVISAIVRANHGALNAGANAGAVRLYPTIGGTSQGNIIPTSTLSYQISSGASGSNDTALGKRMTASANLVLSLHDCAGTGTASTIFTVIVSYLAEKSGD